MRVAELEHMKAENSRLRDENAMLKRRIVSLNADIEPRGAQAGSCAAGLS